MIQNQEYTEKEYKVVKIIDQLQKPMKKLWEFYFLSYLEEVGNPTSKSRSVPYRGCIKLVHDLHAQEEGWSPVTAIKLTQNL